MPQHFIDVALLVMLLLGLAVMIWTSNQTPAPRKGKSQLAATLLLSGAFLLFGMASLWQIRISSHFSIQGQLANLQQRHGKNSSSTFWVLGANGQSKRIHCDYAGNILRNGQLLKVSALEFQGTLLHLSILEGPFAGWELNERDGSLSSIFLIALGLFLSYGGYIKWKRDPEGRDTKVSHQTPINGVDSKSILNLSGKIKSVYKAKPTKSTAVGEASVSRRPRGER